MKRSLLVRGARQLLTLHGPPGPRRGDALRQLGVIEDGSVLIVDGIITNVGPTRRIENLAQAKSAKEISASGKVVMPGFVDSHTYLISAPGRLTDFRIPANSPGMRGDAETFIASLAYVRNTPAGTLEHNGARHLEMCVRHGTTTLEAKTGYGLNGPAELKSLRVLANLDGHCASVVPTFLGAHTVPPESANDRAAYVNWLTQEMLPKIRERKIAEFADVRCAPSAFTSAEAREYLVTARRVGLQVKVHGDQERHSGSVTLGVEMGAISVDGLNFATAADAAALGRSEVIGTLMPAMTHQGSCKRFPPARLLIDSGVPVALATGFHASISSTYSMQMVISLACTHMGMTAEEAIAAATINGAYAAGSGDRCGSLEYGKEADLVILNISDYREIPYYFGSNLASLVMKGGHVVSAGGELTCEGK